MKKLFLSIVVLGLLLGGNVQSMEMTSIEKYLSDKKPDDHNATIYSAIRCSALNTYFWSIILSSNGSKDANKFYDIAEKFALEASKLHSKILSSEFKKSAKMVISTRDKILKNYIKDGEENWVRTGSKFEDSYIDEDRLLCASLYNNVISKW
ncbi:hypothetical protein N8871_02235 [Candidatus Pelagibacter sp.]|nr:hypothetical protein [Candidatus Pelagibacter sp.]